jgi:hypothetical protein
MFSALDLSGVHRGSATAVRSRDYFCPACLQRMVLRSGSRVAAHFAHPAGGPECPAVAIRAGSRAADISADQILLFPPDEESATG